MQFESSKNYHYRYDIDLQAEFPTKNKKNFAGMFFQYCITLLHLSLHISAWNESHFKLCVTLFLQLSIPVIALFMINASFIITIDSSVWHHLCVTNRYISRYRQIKMLIWKILLLTAHTHTRRIVVSKWFIKLSASLSIVK